MSTIDERHERASAGVALNADNDGWYGDFARPRVILQPIAAPSVLGLFGFAGATFIVASNMAGWYGNASTPGYLFPFAAFFGGLAQFLAGMWAYRARDAVATAMHGMWGSFWLAYGLLQLLVATGVLHTGGTLDHALGFWFIALVCDHVLGDARRASPKATSASWPSSAFSPQAQGSQRSRSCRRAPAHSTRPAGSSSSPPVLAWYVATGMMLKGAAGKIVLPLFKTDKESNTPGAKPTRAVELEWGEPGIKKGQ